MSITPENAETEIQKMLDAVDWKPVAKPVGLVGTELYTTHTGTLIFGGHKIRVHQLNDGQRILDADAVAKLFGVE